MATIPPWVVGGSFRLDGTPIVAPAVASSRLCCFADGTTDGEFNYAPRTDSTLLEPIGSRPLAPSALYRFARDWSDPQIDFALVSNGDYAGVGYSAATHSFWLTRNTDQGALVEEWARDGRQISTPIDIPGAVFKGLAVDPADGTLWIVRYERRTDVSRIENFTVSGKRLGAFLVDQVPLVGGIASAEFIWTTRQ
jgi:hypothetical protein